MAGSYSEYRRNRNNAVAHETLCRVFGDVLCAEWQEQYREEVRQWLASPRVNEICEEIRREA